jgi:hypothetical protein
MESPVSDKLKAARCMTFKSEKTRRRAAQRNLGSHDGLRTTHPAKLREKHRNHRF